MSKFTRGPWKSVPYINAKDKKLVTVVIRDSDDQWLGETSSYTASDDEIYANAQLIAAAPDLYKELKKARQGYANLIELGILPYEEWDNDCREYIAGFDAALGKVEGES